jgi:(1->4)-alpha-D-glucan 1-alpha-D-glucosylmutase
MTEYIVKAVREAKIHSTWIKQDNDYEQACVHFIQELLKRDGKNEFLRSFLHFQKKIAFYGGINSLSQIMLKMTCPGVPDFYQGTELWDLTLVDPDNRRPVDFQHRMDLLKEIKSKESPDSIQELLKKRNNGAIKLYLISKVLGIRKQYADLFLNGEYIPLEIQGELQKHLIAFARKLGQSWVMTIVPRFSRQLADEQHQWKNAFLCLSKEAPRQWKDVFTGKKLSIPGKIPLEGLFHHFPVVFLLSVRKPDTRRSPGV